MTLRSPALRTPRGRELGYCRIARFGVRKAADPQVREFFSLKLRGYQRTLLLLRLARALQVVRRSDSSVAAYDLANAIQAQGDARIIDDARAAEIAARLPVPAILARAA
jgi:hypothetical protein